MTVKIHWTVVTQDIEELLDEVRVLYAYATTDLNEILYIGKAEYNTTWQRWIAPDKDQLREDLATERGIDHVAVFVGEREMPPGRRYSPELLEDIESLLIHTMKPWGNIRNAVSKNTHRTGLIVQCIDDWPLAENEFHDGARPSVVRR